jgi:hypothetical protein
METYDILLCGSHIQVLVTVAHSRYVLREVTPVINKVFRYLVQILVGPLELLYIFTLWECVSERNQQSLVMTSISGGDRA